jgi:type II pantothenate kinase
MGKMIKINLDSKIINLPLDKIGIDMGQTLSKFAHLKGGELILHAFPTQSSASSIATFMKSKKEKFKIFNFTGGKSFELYKEYSKNFNTNLINEFNANVKGIEFLHNLEKKKKLTRSLIVTIGTGTSIVLSNDKILHLGGSALGGGFFMGIIKIMFNINNFQEAINLAKKADRYNVDLKVSDIYSPEDDRVNSLFREYTAASLGKIDESFNIQSLNKGDFIHSIISMIGENLGKIANIISKNNDVDNIVFCGGFLIGNRILRRILSILCKVNNKKSIFLKNSEYCAAIGALLT